MSLGQPNRFFVLIFLLMSDLINLQAYGNSSADYFQALLVFVASLIVLKLIQSLILGRLRKLAEKTKTDIDDVLVSIVSHIKPPFYFVLALYISVRSLVLTDILAKTIHIIFIALLVFEAVSAAQKIIKFLLYRSLKKGGNDAQARTTAHTLTIIAKIILWSFALLLILSNIGVDITSLIAGLGIGGIAVALALQNILSDIFSSFSILIDKPFEAGDFIKIGTDMGVVEKIGIKTTRIRTLDGQILVVSNKELTTARVENFKKAEKRRAFFTLGVTYETPKDKLAKIPAIIKEIANKQGLVEFDRCHFKSFADFSLNFEVAFYVNTKDYNTFLDVLEQVNLEIFARFNQEAISFAYPTQTLYKKDI